jgi:hypothetical protein
MEKDIYQMKLHESFCIGYNDITRVPGGWIYTKFNEEYQIESSVFVPFHNEFQIVEKGADPREQDDEN